MNTTAIPEACFLGYYPPYAWSAMRDFFIPRLIPGMEWVDENSYGRCIQWENARGHFTAIHDPQRHGFRVELELSDLRALAPVVRQIRRLLDLDADTQSIEARLAGVSSQLSLVEGLRLPGVWNLFEAGVRAILGQHISEAVARNLTETLVMTLGEPLEDSTDQLRYLFPTPERIAASDLAFLGMPGARRATLKRFADWYCQAEAPDDPKAWTALKGIGPWTADYAALRGLSHPDIWLGGDLGVRKALKLLEDFDPATAAPWRSYFTLQLWQHLWRST